MKTVLITLLCCIAFLSKAQTAADIFDKKTTYPFTWLGIDYSHVKIVESLQLFGGTAELTAEEVKNKYFKSWNELILKERDKYSIEAMMKVPYITYDISMIGKINDSAHVEDLVSPGPPAYTQEQIQEFVNAYQIENKNGIGIVFIAESMNKRVAEAYYHIAIINMQTQQILIQQRLKGKPGGAGIRNYWAGSYLDAMTSVRENFYSKWKAKYAPKSVQTTPTW